jgi:hypothetical protein
MDTLAFILRHRTRQVPLSRGRGQGRDEKRTVMTTMTTVVVLGDLTECISMLEESEMMLQMITHSSYNTIRPVQHLTMKWRPKVKDMMALVVALEECHRYWKQMDVRQKRCVLFFLLCSLHHFLSISQTWELFSPFFLFQRQDCRIFICSRVYIHYIYTYVSMCVCVWGGLVRMLPRELCLA